MGNWFVILPTAGTNMVLNPVAMGTGNYTQRAGTTVTQSTTYSYLGYKSYRVETNADAEGIDLVLAALSNAIHQVSVRVRGTLPAAWTWSVDGANWTTPTLQATEGDWSVYTCQFSAAQSNASVVLYIIQSGAGAGDFYLGHIQVERDDYTTTPITGDIVGFKQAGYYWNGAAHSSSSTRSSQERSGGYKKDLEDYNFRVKYGDGIGMPPITHHVQGMALLPGALYQGHKVQPRILDLVTGTKATTVATVTKARKDFINAIKPDKVTPEQPVVFRCTGINSDKPVDIYAYYDSGLEFNLSSGIVDQPVVRFICYDPFAYEVHSESAALTTYTTVSDADYAIRKISGAWYNLSTNFDGSVRALAMGKDGCVYLGGLFTIDAPDTDYIVRWNPFTLALSQLSGTGTNNSVYALATASNGDIYLGGSFTDLADANGDRISRFDGTNFNSLSTGIGSGTVYALCFDHTGNLYVGGSFTNVFDANGDYITKWDGTAFSSLSTGADATIYAIACAPNNDIYVAGQFANIGGGAAAGIAKWNGTAWSALGAGITGGAADGFALAIDKAGNVYVAGEFTTADGVTCANIARWNGKTFEPLGSGLNGRVQSLYIDDNGLLYAGGAFTTAGGLDADSIALWNGTTWAHLDVGLAGPPTVTAILASNDNLYLGYDGAGDALASYLNTVSNSGSATAYPVIKIQKVSGGTTTAAWIKNETTGDTLYLNYVINTGETLTFDLTPGERRIYSDYFGDVWNAVLRSSDLSTFRLMPGTNLISIYVIELVVPTVVVAWAEWKITHWGADMVAA